MRRAGVRDDHLRGRKGRERGKGSAERQAQGKIRQVRNDQSRPIRKRKRKEEKRRKVKRGRERDNVPS